MPGPSGKKRLGSRRKVATRVGMQDDLSAGDHSPVLHPQEIAQSFSDLSNEGQAHWVRSSEEKSSKLGSSRQSKRRDAELSSIEPGHKSTEEVEQIVSTEKLQTEMSPAAQAVRQKDFSELDDCESIFGTHLYSDFTPGHGFEPLSPTYLGAGVQIRPPECETLHLGRDDAESDCKQGVGLHDQSEFAMSAQHVLEDAENEDPLEPVEALQDEFSVESEEMDFLSSPERRPEKKSCRENVDDNRDDHPMNQHTVEVSEQRHEKDYACNTTETWTNTEKTDHTQSQAQDTEAQAMSDAERSSKRVLSGTADSLQSLQSEPPEPSFAFDSQTECNTAGTDEQRDSLRSPIKVFASKEYGDFNEDATGSAGDDGDHPTEMELADMNKSRLPEMDNLDTFSGQYPDSVSTQHLKSLETGHGEDSGTLSPARNRRKLGSTERRNKGRYVKVFDPEVCNKSADESDGNSRDEKDYQETKDTTFREETAEVEITKINWLNKDTNIERGPTEAIMSPPQEEVEGQCEPFNISGGRRTENLENRVKKMFQEKVKPVEMAAGTAGQQASQEHMNPTPKAAEEIEVQLVHRLKTEEDSISPNSDRNEVAASQGEVPETLCNSNEHANVYRKSSMNVRDSEETLQVKDIDDVSFKERSLESVLQAKKGAQEEIGLSSQQMGLRNLSLTSTEKGEKSSARRPQIETKREAEMDGEDETRALKNVQVLEDPAQTGALHQGEPDLTGLESDPQLPDSSRRRNVIPAADDVGTVFSEQVSSRCAFLSASQVADVTGSDSEIPVAMGTFQPDYAPVSEDHVMSSADIESKRKQQMCSDKGGVDHESFSTVAAQVPSQERTGALPNTREIITESDGEPDKNLKSPSVNLTNRKRKMGTTRRNLGTISKRDLEPKLDTSTEATLTAPERGRQGKEKETRPDSSGSEPTPETAGDPPSTAPAHQTAQENLTAESQPAGRDIPQKPSTVPRLDALSETEPGGGKRKLGSRRKSRVPQTRVDQSEADNAIRTQPETSTQQHAEDVLRGPEELQVTSAEKATPYRSPQGGLHLGQDILSFGESSSDLKAKRFNVVMIGDSYVGKTSFMKRAQNGKFFPDCAASAGLDTCLWTVIVDGKPVALQLWDTAGQERFRSITNQIYHRAHAFLLMYDITSSQSFAAVHYWARCIQEGAAENVPILLLGNKNDHTKRTVTTEEGQNVAKEFNVGFMECSAVTGDNVIQSLEAVARLLSQNDDGRQETPGLHKEPPKNKSGCC
ncbi:ras-related protein Rab-44 isoform X2 [Syngnathoides biaculeatus]|uniref:ras-related protein Rab-44 isoform X2 n=1 Tax=Syngnathoides biaculeatus TaxID=300417 RepID=UPI002ADE472A|nr:ras-related protein Rab-44 isoform X2 [Syngnathoides biaculeatus]